MRVLIVDDDRVLSEALRHVLSCEPDIEVVGHAVTRSNAADMARALHPDVVLMDHLLPDGEGVDLAASLHRSMPRTRVVMLTGGSKDGRLAARAAAAGCAGFVVKGQHLTEVVAALRRAGSESSPGRSRGRLSGREVEVLQHLARGLANKSIAKEMNLSLNTVRNHVQRILGKLDAHSRLEAVSMAVRENLIRYP